MAEDAALLSCRGLSKTYGKGAGLVRAVNGFDLDVATGETVAIMGPSGCGKSTLLHLLGGLDRPSGGEVRLAGRRVDEMSEKALARLRQDAVGFVFQAFHLMPALTALENVMLPLELAGRSDARSAATETLAEVGLEARTGHYPRQLSGGEQQRVAIARAFVTRPAVLFADEPTGNLDTVTGARVGQLLFGLNRSAHTTLVLVTHDADLAGRCSRLVRMEAGRAR